MNDFEALTDKIRDFVGSQVKAPASIDQDFPF